LQRLRLFGVAVIFVILTGMAATAQTISIELQGDAFKVSGWRPPSVEPTDGWSSVFAVYAGTGDLPPLIGTYSVEDGSLVFHPSYPFAAGVRYRAVFHVPGGTAFEKIFDGPRKDTTPTTRVEQIYPSADILPSNQLRLYIYFSAPMSRGEAGRDIRVLDANGKVLPDVFLPAEELWDPNYDRLTMTFDPGRIKRGLTSNEKMGPPIEEGKRYTVVVDHRWQDARGVPLVADFRKTFRGGPAERNPPDTKQWHVTAPKADSVGTVVVDFPTPMNYALLQRMIRVSGDRGDVAGTVGIDHHEAEWRFTPREPWQAGNYNLVVDTNLEDLAGNHIGQPFDIDVFERVTEHITTKTISLPFDVR
jgi:hypothetical protein